jgi:hypothetical protein
MVIEDFFIHYQMPAQFVYWGENYLDIYRFTDPGKTFKKILSIDNVSAAAISPGQFQDIARELLKIDTGVILNSGQFIFNIFEFEKIPWQKNVRKDLVEWRLKKVFPENLEDYAHHFFKLSKNRIFSILLKKNLKEKIEELFRESGISLVHMGNSTVEIINHVTRLKKDAPDFFIEIDNNLSIAVFQDRTVPFYIRKFRSAQTAELVNEVMKTINFVKNSYARTPRTFSLLVRRFPEDSRAIGAELSMQDILPLELKRDEQFIFPIKRVKK